MREDLELKISMLMDGELEASEEIRVLTEIRSNPELLDKWNRYHAVRCARAGQGTVLVERGFLEKVSEAVADEPVVFSPAAARRDTPRRTLTYAAALAASVAIVGFFSWSSLPTGLEQPPSVPALASTEAPAAPVAVDLSRSRQFNDYVITHNESAYRSGGQPMLPYARVVSFPIEN